MTPYEFYLFSKGNIEREQEEWQRTAQLASWLISAWIKDAPSADRLLGKVKLAPLMLSEKDLNDFMKDREKDRE